MEHLNEACWDGYKQVGMKNHNGKMVPNCVPMEEGLKDIVQDLKKVGKVTRHTAFRAPGEAQELIRRLKALQAARAEKATTVNEDEVNEYCSRCLIEVLMGQHSEQLGEAQYQGRTVPLGKPMRGDVKKFKVYVRDPKTGNIKKVNFGDKTMKIKKSNPARRKSFRARHRCDTNPGPRTKARYWSCRKW